MSTYAWNSKDISILGVHWERRPFYDIPETVHNCLGPKTTLEELGTWLHVKYFPLRINLSNRIFSENFHLTHSKTWISQIRIKYQNTTHKTTFNMAIYLMYYRKGILYTRRLIFAPDLVKIIKFHSISGIFLSFLMACIETEGNFRVNQLMSNWVTTELLRLDPSLMNLKRKIFIKM